MEDARTRIGFKIALAVGSPAFIDRVLREPASVWVWLLLILIMSIDEYGRTEMPPVGAQGIDWTIDIENTPLQIVVRDEAAATLVL